MRLAVVGKGGAGKSVISATLARTLARRGSRVLALDSDPLPGLTYSLGADPPPAESPLLAATERGEDKRWRFVRGVGPARVVQRFSTVAPDGVRVLQLPKTTREGMAPVIGATQAFYKTIHGLHRVASLRDWVIIGDLPAGPRQVAFEWAPYAEHFVLVVERARPGTQVSLVVNKSTGRQDEELVSGVLGLPVLQAVPVDEGVRGAELAGVALLDHAPDSAAVRAIERLADGLERSSVVS